MRRNPTEFAILGLLAEQPMTGYDIKREVEARLSSFWSESYGHIYPMLRRLRERKLVTMRLVAGRSGPAHRKLYALTAAGRAALGAWFETPITPSRPRNELLLRVFFGRHAPPGVLARDLEAYGKSSLAIVEQLAAVRRALDEEEPDSPDREYLEAVLDAGERIFETLGRWSRDTLSRFEARRGQRARGTRPGRRAGAKRVRST